MKLWNLVLLLMFLVGPEMIFEDAIQYDTWIPEFSKSTTIIAIGNTHLIEEYPKWISIYQQLFDKVDVTSHIFCPYARDDRNACFHVYICRGLKYDSEAFKQLFQDRIFE